MATAIQLTPSERAERAETRAQTWRRRYRELQDTGEVVTERVTGAIVTVAGGAFAGVIWSKFGNGTPGSARWGDTSIEIDTMLGVGLVGAAALGMAGKHSGELGTFGGGMLAARAAAWVGRVLEESEQKSAAAAAANTRQQYQAAA